MAELFGEQAENPRERADIRARPDLRQEEQTERVPLGGNRMRLTMEEIPGYHTHILNDVADRIERALRGGYVFRPKAGTRMGDGPELGHTDIGSAVSIVVGKHEDGSPLRGYAMMIKQEWYEEDQRAKQRQILETEAELKRGLKAQDGDASQMYIPEEGISIR